jgi:hypothetical protein
MDMATSVKAVLGSVAVCGVLLLAGCGGSSSVTAESGWNPPRPSGVPDETWEAVVDPASLPQEELAGGYCLAVKPEPAEVDAKVQEYPGATVAEFNDFYDYLLTYVTPLCADLPTATGVKGVKRMSAQVVADL